MQPVTDRAEYLALFSAVTGNHRAIGEASTSYLWDAKTPERIRATVPDAKIIILLRDPLERAFSHYLLDVREGVQRAPFLEAISEDYANPEKRWGVSHLYVELGMYCEQVKRYMDCFARSQILILVFEDFVANTDACLERTLSFLDVDEASLYNIQYRLEHNVYAEPRSRSAHWLLGLPGLRAAQRKLLPKRFRKILHDKVFLREAEKSQMDSRAVQLLRETYEPEVACLEKLLGTQLPWNLHRGDAE
jgi:hypothetical protein